MKKIFVFLSVVFLAVSANALSLFPFFVDLAGNYIDGPVTALQPLGVECMHSSKCNDFKTIDAADAFLKDVLPYSNYSIMNKKVKKDGTDMAMYASLLEDGKTSVFCLIELPGDGLYVIYDELPGNPFKIE